MNLQGIVTDEEALRYILAGLDREREGIQDRVREIEARLRPAAVRQSDIQRTSAKDARIAARRALTAGQPVTSGTRSKRRLSASARERIRQGQIKRWKAFREKRGE